MKARHSAFLIMLPALFVASVTPVSAQVVSAGSGISRGFPNSVYGIGFFGGPATGLGLSFRHHLPGFLSYQITAGAISIEKRTSYDFGLELQLDVFRATTSRFYVAGGGAYFFSGDGNGGNTMKGPVRLGLGVGVEYAAGPGLHVMGDLLFTYFSDATVLPLPQLGIFYYFD